MTSTFDLLKQELQEALTPDLKDDNQSISQSLKKISTIKLAMFAVGISEEGMTEDDVRSEIDKINHRVLEKEDLR
jgi:hypothetical protein